LIFEFGINFGRNSRLGKGYSITTDHHEGSVKLIAKDRQTRFSRRSSLTLRRDVQSCNSGSKIVTMMQPAKPWHRYDFATCIGILRGLTTGRRSLRQREMRSIFVVVTDVLVHQAFQMPFIQDDHMVKQISSTASDPALGNTILPRTSETGSFRLDAQCLNGTDDALTEVRSPIEDQILRRRIVGECFAQLLRNPCATRMTGMFQCRMRRRSCAMTKKQYNTPKVRVGTVKKSIAAIASR
jgi:hypothetical protein